MNILQCKFYACYYMLL